MVDQAFQSAVQHHQAGQLPEAEALYRQILAQEPRHCGALHFLGVLAYQVNRHDDAAALIRQAIAVRPQQPELYSDLGNVLTESGQIDEAIAACQRAIALRPNYSEAYVNLGNALKAQARFDDAIAAFGQAIAQRSNFPEAHFNLANVLSEIGDTEQAIAAYRQALALRPNYVQACENLANVLSATGQPDEAIAAYRRVIALQPNSPEACSNLGNALFEKGDVSAAIAACRQAIALRPAYAEAYNNLGNALSASGDLDGAIAAFRQVVALCPDYVRGHSNLVFSLYYHPDYDAQAIAEEHRLWNQRHALPLSNVIRPHANDRDPARRLRIGYVSPDFRDHVVGRNLLPLFEKHDRREFELFCYANVPRPDAMTTEFQRQASAWRNIVGLSDERIAEQIREDRIDILVDLALHSAGGRLLVFARKPAPVQATFAGYPGTTGLTAIDYRLSDPYLDPPGMDESIYSERTIRLPDSFWCYDPLDCRHIPVGPLPANRNGFITFGCLNNFVKVNDATVRAWGQVMQKVEGSRLLLSAAEGESRQRVLAIPQQEGIDPARVQFTSRCPRREYLELYHRIDVGLDTFPYNGHTTSLDSFWMGVPVVTRVGSTSVARAGWSQLSNLGLTELAAPTPEEFVRLAAELANDRPRLEALRSSLRSRMEASPLMNAAQFARSIEAAYRTMWRTWCSANRD